MASQLSVNSGGKEYLEPATRLLAPEFYDDPGITYMLSHMSRAQRVAYMPEYFTCLIKASLLNNAVIEQIDDWSSCAVWVPPGSKIDNPRTYIAAGFLSVLWNVGLGGIKRMLFEFQAESDRAKKDGLTSRGHTRWFYLWLIGTASDQRGRGLASELIRLYQAKAAAENLPIWLESTTDKSRALYERLGFEVVRVIELGKGKCASNGTREKGGEGIRLFAMIWEPRAGAKAQDAVNGQSKE